ncbi:Arogenate dehydrogenase 2, chloroplastic [Ancistrocladus abbreviatus]
MFSVCLQSPSSLSTKIVTQTASFSCNSPSARRISPTLHFLCRRIPRHHRRNDVEPLRIRNIDAAQPYDYESKLSDLHSASSNLKIGIIGFGNYGQFLAKTLVKQGHKILAHSRSNYSEIAAELGVSFFSDPNDLCEEHPEVILLCTSILSTESVLRSLPLQRLRRSTLFVDVLSVKEFPRSLFLKILPPDFDVLCTHPMFGPESGKNGWSGLPFVYDKVRIGRSQVRVKRCDNFINAFRREGCRMVEMSCAEHDRYAAGSQFITHMMGRVLEKLNLEDTPINTKGYESLLNLVENTSKDSFELFYGLFLYNGNAIEQLHRLTLAFELVKQQLFGNLHGLLRKQHFDGSEMKLTVQGTKLMLDASANGVASSSASPRDKNDHKNGSAMDVTVDKEENLALDVTNNGVAFGSSSLGDTVMQ